MNTNDRIGLFESLLDTFLTRTKENGHIVFEVHGHSAEYVQYKVHGDAVYGEVGSRQWSEPERPLPPTAVDGLARLGFLGGGPERNFAQDGLPRSVPALARLTDNLLRTAYDLDEDYCAVMGELNLQDVTLPRAEPFTREMIAAHLRDNEIRFFRDEDGDFMVHMTGPNGEMDTVWFIAEGEGDAIYRISTCVQRGPESRQEALELCNDWNRSHRWPKAFVIDDGESWHIILRADIDLEPGVTRALFDDFTKRVASGMVEFWSAAGVRADGLDASGTCL